MLKVWTSKAPSLCHCSGSSKVSEILTYDKSNIVNILRLRPFLYKCSMKITFMEVLKLEIVHSNQYH